MKTIVVVGAGLGGMSAAYDLKNATGQSHRVVLVNPAAEFQFTPSNPWVGVGWREPDEVVIAIAPHAEKHGIQFIASALTGLLPADNKIELADGRQLYYDYLVLTTGPRLAFEAVPGMGPENHTHSICTTPHAEETYRAYQQLLEAPGPIVVGAAQGASCFGPAYEFAFILDADLRKRKIREQTPITFVTSEPYIGHMGLAGVGDSRGLLESEFRKRDIAWVANAKVDEATASSVKITECDDRGIAVNHRDVPSAFTMLIPSFKGIDALASVPGLCNDSGFVLIDEFQRNPKYPNIFAAGVCVAIPPVEQTPVPTGAPKTGYMIESMVTAIVENIEADMEGRPATARPTWNAICLADMGDSGAAFVALPQIPPRQATWARKGKWAHLGKIAFEKYFMHKMRSGHTEPVYEKYVLKALGIERLKDGE